MRVAVLGAGAVGGAFAALLDAAGHAVTVTARGSVPTIAAHGIRLTGAFGEHVARVEALPALDERPDLAILATKAHDSEAALSASLEALTDVPMLSAQNGLAGHERAAAIVGHARVAAAVTTWASNAVEPGVVHVTASGDTLIGGAAGAVFLDLLSGAMPRVAAMPDPLGAQWTKLVINMANAVPAATGRSMQECVADPGLLRVMGAAMQEAAGVGVALGVRFADVGSVTAEQIAAIAASREAAEALPVAMAAAFGTVPNLGSTLQSLLRGQRTEVDALGGEVVAAAARAGTAVPVNAGLVAIVHRVESTGDFASRDDVAALAA